MTLSIQALGKSIRHVRKQLRVTQSDVALAAGTGVRFISDLEKGKPTCQIGKVLEVMQVLGIQLTLSHAEVKSLET